ncbi:MAG TPA: DUF3108 domain-containing protein [Woeseiaceae bacterium]|nr:DUF3108 domain-containing protein [Woeseiaceae bacterium]
MAADVRPGLFAGLPLLLLPVLNATAAPPPITLKPHRVEYNVEISILNGRLTTVVTAVGDGFMANSIIVPVGFSKVVAHGSIQESSFFLVDEQGVRPERYRSVDTLSTEDQTVTFDFKWAAHRVEGMINGEPITFPLDGRVHDRVSIQYELMLDLLTGEAKDKYVMLDGDELKHLEVKNIGSRTVKVPYGTFEAVGIQHGEKDSSRVTVLWCAKELDYLPVVIEQLRDGEVHVRASLAEYELLPETEEAAAPL